MSGDKRGRQKMMEDILNSHYDESKPKRRYHRKSKYVVACDMCDFTADSMNKLGTHIQVHLTTMELEYEFFVPDSSLILCKLLSSLSSFEKKAYYKKNIIKRVSWKSLPSIQLEHIFPSEQLLLFIPKKLVDKVPDIKSWENQVIPYKEIDSNIFAATFPSLVETVYLAEDFDKTLKSISEEKMVMFSGARFESIQQLIPLNSFRLPQARFCEYFIPLGQSQNLENLDTKLFPSTKEQNQLKTQVKHEKSKMLNKAGVEVFNCPMANCKFVSVKKFTGIRVHLTKHFENQIRLGAKNKTDVEILIEAIPSCLVKWVCSIEKLVAEGDLIHHYGILHCLVDKFFKTYVIKRLPGNYCLYDSLSFLDEDDFAEHMTVDHYFDLILGEVENKVYFKESAFSVEYKCPFCNRMFENSTGTESREIRDLVKHCGLDHGFTFYHVFLEQIKKQTNKTQVKTGSDAKLEFTEIDKENVKQEITDYSIKVESSDCIEVLDDEEVVYKCNQCAFKSTQLIHLKKHQRSHGRKKYFCNQCEFGTKWKSNLNLHLVDHAQSVFRCDQCDFVDDCWFSQKHQTQMINKEQNTIWDILNES